MTEPVGVQIRKFAGCLRQVMVGVNRTDHTGSGANTTIGAPRGIDHRHDVPRFGKDAVFGADGNACLTLDADAGFGDDVGHAACPVWFALEVWTLAAESGPGHTRIPRGSSGYSTAHRVVREGNTHLFIRADARADTCRWRPKSVAPRGGSWPPPRSPDSGRAPDRWRGNR